MSQPDFDGIVILGFPRSGTTLLRRLLEPHPSLCCPPETHLLRAAAAFLHNDDSPLGYSPGVLTSLRFVGIEPQSIVDRLRAMVWSVYDEICRAQGKPIWVEKSALDMFHLDELELLCGDRCRFIWLTRHPLDAVCSVKEYVGTVETYYPELHDYVRRYPAPLEAFAHAWVDTQRRMLRFAASHADTCLRVRYEELAADPARTLKEVLDFVGLGGDPAALVGALNQSTGTIGYGDWKSYERPKVDDQSVGRYAKLHPRLIDRLASIVNPLMAEIGYPAVTVSAAALKTDPVRELQIRLTASQRFRSKPTS